MELVAEIPGFGTGRIAVGRQHIALFLTDFDSWCPGKSADRHLGRVYDDGLSGLDHFIAKLACKLIGPIAQVFKGVDYSAGGMVKLGEGQNG